LPCFVELLIAEGEEAALGIAGGAVNEEIHTPKPSAREINDTLDLTEQIEVGADDMRRSLTISATSITLSGFEASRILGDKDDPRAFLAEGPRDLTPNTLTGASDKRGLSLQSQLHRPLLRHCSYGRRA
jgi:hypothetical protein